MKSISKIMIAIVVLLSLTNSFAQIKNAKTEKVKIAGNCEMCKKRIEDAGNEKNISKVIWSEKTQIATIKFDSEKTTAKEILTRIATVGHDSEMVQTSNETYTNLPECCQYDRKSISTQKVTFACAVHHNEVSSEKRKCSKCGMELVETNVHKHDSSIKGSQSKSETKSKYVCKMCGTLADKAGKCSKCGMDMTLEETKK